MERKEFNRLYCSSGMLRELVLMSQSRKESCDYRGLGNRLMSVGGLVTRGLVEAAPGLLCFRLSELGKEALQFCRSAEIHVELARLDRRKKILVGVACNPHEYRQEAKLCRQRAGVAEVMADEAEADAAGAREKIEEIEAQQQELYEELRDLD